MFNSILRDIGRTYEYMHGSRIKKTINCLRSPGVQAIIIYRFGYWLVRRNLLLRIVLEPFYFVFNVLVKVSWGIDLPRGAVIGKGLYVAHFGNIFVSPRCTIGENCNISQEVTIGVSGTGNKKGAPVIGNGVYIAPGAKVFGKITIGNNVKIGANAVVYKDIPDNAIVVMEPGFSILSYKGNRSVD